MDQLFANGIKPRHFKKAAVALEQAARETGEKTVVMEGETEDVIHEEVAQ